MEQDQRSHPLRRGELAALGIQLPVLATVCPVPLPTAPDWPRRLERADLDVITTGHTLDDPDSWLEAVGAVPHRPVMALADDAAGATALARAGCRLVCTRAAAPPDLYTFSNERSVVAVSGAGASVEDVNEIAARILEACTKEPASSLWVSAGLGLSDLPVDIVDAKLRALTEGARQARLWLAKEQFDRSPGPS